MSSCARCGSKIDGGFSLRLRLCGLCQQAVNLLTKSKSKIRPLDDPKDSK